MDEITQKQDQYEDKDKRSHQSHRFHDETRR